MATTGDWLNNIASKIDYVDTSDEEDNDQKPPIIQQQTKLPQNNYQQVNNGNV
jgi:hypothetical protein